MSGGARAAFGYRYQYLVTVQFFLRYVRDHLGDVASTVLHVEPAGFATRGLAADDEIVDFAVEVADTVVVSAQVKASADPAANELFPGEAGTVFERLLPERGTRALLLTHRALSSGVVKQCAEPARVDGTVVERQYTDAGSTRAGGERLIRADGRSLEDLVASVAALFREFRRDRHLTLSESTARLVSINLLYRMFGGASGTEPVRLSVSKFVDLKVMPDAEVGHASGGFD